MKMKITGNLQKMTSALDHPVSYGLPVGEQVIALNKFIGQQLTLEYDGEINCIACGRKTNKSFNQGYCFPCMRSLAECDMCIVRPEQCHLAEGTCRDEEWAKDHCLRDHVVYLANSSALKVGITRISQVPTRWIDQGATQALPIFRVTQRLHSGLLEVILKNHISDRTDWRKMLKGEAEPMDLAARRDELAQLCEPEINELREKLGDGAIHFLTDETVTAIEYPVRHYPDKVKSLSFDKSACIQGELQGIKGQYLIFPDGVINMRKFAGYKITISTP
jgi:hypothetical protein